MVTMTQVAKRANVSLATVSYVLNKRGEEARIGLETRERVLEAAGELGYRRNALLDAVRAKHNKMLGFLVHRPENEAVARMLAGALDEAEAHGYTIKVLRLRDHQVHAGIIEKCLELRLAGVMVLYLRGATLEKLHAEMQKFGIPVAVLDTPKDANEGEVQVSSDDGQAMQLAVEHLKKLGHTRIAWYSPDQYTPEGAFLNSFTGRSAAFLAAMKKAKLPVAPQWNLSGLGPQESEPRLMELLLRRKRGELGAPTAYVAALDGLGLQIVQLARSAGVAVPDDISIISYGDLSLAHWSLPPLTTVSQPFHEIGQISVQRLLSRLNEESQVRSNSTVPAAVELLPSRLVERASCAPCRNV